jgi:hypothetical protein
VLVVASQAAVAAPDASSAQCPRISITPVAHKGPNLALPGVFLGAHGHINFTMPAGMVCGSWRESGLVL